MAYLEPSNPAFFCSGVHFINGMFSFRFGESITFRGKGSYIDHHDKYSEIEGELTSDGLRGTLINIDLFADRSRGIFTFPSVPDMFINVAQYFSFLIFSHNKNMTIFSSIGRCRRIDESSLIINDVGGSHAQIIRNHDSLWGPNVFRGHIPKLGPVTVYV